MPGMPVELFSPRELAYMDILPEEQEEAGITAISFTCLFVECMALRKVTVES
jgi:hypothetical protein